MKKAGRALSTDDASYMMILIHAIILTLRAKDKDKDTKLVKGLLHSIGEQSFGAEILIPFILAQAD